MESKLVPAGFGSYLVTDRIVAIAIPKSAPIKRLVRAARDKGLAIDLTEGRRLKAVVFTDSQYIVLLALAADTIDSRIGGGES